MYVSADRLDDALRELVEMQKRNPDVKLTPLKVMKMAQLMLKEGKTDGEIYIYLSIYDEFIWLLEVLCKFCDISDHTPCTVYTIYKLNKIEKKRTE